MKTYILTTNKGFTFEMAAASKAEAKEFAAKAGHIVTLRNIKVAPTKVAEPEAVASTEVAEPKAAAPTEVAVPTTKAVAEPKAAAPTEVAVPTTKAVAEPEAAVSTEAAASTEVAEPEAAAPEAAAAEAAEEKAANKGGALVELKEFKLTAANDKGGALDTMDKSLFGFGRKIENEIKVYGTQSTYFVEAFKAYIACGFGGTTEAVEAKFAEFTEKMLKESTLFRTMANHNKLNAIFKANLCRYYVADANGMKSTIIAKAKRVAISVDAISKAEKAVYEESCNSDKPKYKKVTICGSAYYVSNKVDATEIEKGFATLRTQCRTNFAAPEALPKVWKNESGHIYTLVEKETFGYKELVPTLAKVMYCKAAKVNYVAAPKAASTKAAKPEAAASTKAAASTLAAEPKAAASTEVAAPTEAAASTQVAEPKAVASTEAAVPTTKAVASTEAAVPTTKAVASTLAEFDEIDYESMFM